MVCASCPETQHMNFGWVKALLGPQFEVSNISMALLKTIPPSLFDSANSIYLSSASLVVDFAPCFLLFVLDLVFGSLFCSLALLRS